MKKLIDLFNKKYGSVYGVIDDSIDNEDVYKVYKMIKTLCSDDQEIMEMLNKIKLPSPRTAKESIEKVNINVSGGLSKEYVDEKTEILPVKNTYTILTDATPIYIEDMSTYNVVSGAYIFESLQNEDMIISAVKFNLNVTFNDGTNDITKDLILEGDGHGYGFYGGNDIVAVIDYNKTEHLIYMNIIEANEHTPYDILRATLSCDTYSNLLQNNLIQSIDYSKIKDVPSILNYIVDGRNRTLQGEEYYNLFDNLFIWDANKFNERLDENSGVKQNLSNGQLIMVKQKDGEGIGFGQHIPINSSKSLYIVTDAGKDVIIKIYNSTTKELIGTIDYCETDKYTRSYLTTYELNGASSVFLAFTVKDSVTNFNGRTYINKLIVYNDSSFLTKGELLTKTNTKEYQPTEDYNPATKKYVDEKTILEPLPIYDTKEATNVLQYIVNIMDLDKRKTYGAVQHGINKATSYKFVYICDDGTQAMVGSFADNVNENHFRVWHYTNSSILYCGNYYYNIDYTNHATRTDVVVTNEIRNYLNIYNTKEYTPEEDYNPATKKYVDDKFIGIDLEIVGTIPQSELQRCNDGTSRYISSIDFDTLFSEPNNYLYYATYKDDTLIPIEYDTEYNRMVTNSLDSVDGVSVNIGFDYGTHKMYPFNGGMASIKAYTFTNDLIIKRRHILNADMIATKEYVDKRVGNSVITVNNVNGSLTLTTDKNQYATLAVPVEIILPTVTSFTELHLFFNGSEGVTIGTTNVKWESQVTIENNKSYEIIFTYVNESIGWLAKTVVYS